MCVLCIKIIIYSQIHPIEGVVDLLYKMAEQISRPVYGLQCTKDVPLDDMAAIASFYVKQVQTVQPRGPFILAGYSFGACVAFEMALQLEKVTTSAVSELTYAPV